MQLRNAKLIPTKSSGKIFKIETNDVDVRCWRDCGEVCSSDCAAWRIENNVLMCLALPTDKRVAQVTTEE